MRDVHTISRLNSSMIFPQWHNNERTTERRRPCGNCSYNGTGNILTVQLGKLARGDKTMAKLDFHIFDSAQFQVNVAASFERTAMGMSVTHLHLIYGMWLRFALCVCVGARHYKSTQRASTACGFSWLSHKRRREYETQTKSYLDFGPTIFITCVRIGTTAEWHYPLRNGMSI